MYNISHMKFSTSSCSKILAPLAYIKVVAVNILLLYGNLERKKKNSFELNPKYLLKL